MLAIQNVPDTGKSKLNHDRRSDAVAGAHAGEVEGLFDVLGIADPAP